MRETTAYLPEALEVRLDAEAAATGISKAELIRRRIAMLLEQSARPRQSRPLPVFDSGRPLTADAVTPLPRLKEGELPTRRLRPSPNRPFSGHDKRPDQGSDSPTG